MFRRAFRFLLSASLVLSPVAFMTGGCTRQAEGERCDYDWAGETQDCDDGLKCVSCKELQNRQADRCCRIDNAVTDSRCARTIVDNDDACGTHTSEGSGGTRSTDGTAGSGTAGASAGSGTGGTGDTGGEGGALNSSAGVGG